MRKSLIAVILVLALSVPVFGTDQQMRISAEAAVLIDVQDNEVLFARSADRRMQPASMTKIMTAVLVIENCGADDLITIDASCAGTEGSSAYLQAGETFTVSELLYALLLQSANDAAVALARHAAGSVETFVGMMNDKAAALGLHGTHFTNPHGLSDKDHYSTALDIANLLCYCMKNPTFKQISGAREYVIKPNENRRGRYFVNHNKLLFTCDGVIGGKTGYTMSSGRCLCSYYEKDGVKLCAVTMNAPRDWSDHAALYEFGSSQYKNITLDMAGIYSLHVVGGITDHTECTVDDNVSVNIKNGVDKIEKTVYMRRFEYAPVEAGEKIGELVFSSGGKIIYTYPLYADYKVEAVKDRFIWKK
ncbi:MAG: D-alanyl-D-alanine carboxypeptidase [Clostridia bacterium]|nr:D-alanyl-D-alanine carboxypeptidase [Clostridia bacterium]